MLDELGYSLFRFNCSFHDYRQGNYRTDVSIRLYKAFGALRRTGASFELNISARMWKITTTER